MHAAALRGCTMHQTHDQHSDAWNVLTAYVCQTHQHCQPAHTQLQQAFKYHGRPCFAACTCILVYLSYDVLTPRIMKSGQVHVQLWINGKFNIRGRMMQGQLSAVNPATACGCACSPPLLQKDHENARTFVVQHVCAGERLHLLALTPAVAVMRQLLNKRHMDKNAICTLSTYSMKHASGCLTANRDPGAGRI